MFKKLKDFKIIFLNLFNFSIIKLKKIPIFSIMISIIFFICFFQVNEYNQHQHDLASIHLVASSLEFDIVDNAFTIPREKQINDIKMQVQLENQILGEKNENNRLEKIEEEKRIAAEKLRIEEEKQKEIEAKKLAEEKAQAVEQLIKDVLAFPVPTKYANEMTQVGINATDQHFAYTIIYHESKWIHTNINSSGNNYGYCQADMNVHGKHINNKYSDYKTNPITQLEWCDNYVSGRYGDWEKAYRFWIKRSSF